MKVILEYLLPDETDDYTYAMNGAKYLFALQEFDNYLRSQLKYDNALNEEQCHQLQRLRSKLHECLTDHGVTIYE